MGWSGSLRRSEGTGSPRSPSRVLRIALVVGTVVTAAISPACGGSLETGSTAPLSTTLSSGPTETPTSLGSPTTAADAPTPSVGWERLPGQESLEGGFFNAVASTGDRLIGVGGASIGYYGPAPAAWASNDGRTWDRIDSPSFALEDDTSTGAMLDVVIADTGIVAVGYTGPDRFEVDAAVWISDDGIEWERVVDDAFGGVGIQAMRSVTVVDDHLVAVGSDDVFPGAWYSTDGLSWERASGLESSPGTILDLAALDGQVVGVGYFMPDGTVTIDAGVPFWADLDFSIWLSSDGRSWRALAESSDAVLPVDPVDSFSALASILATPQGFLSFGTVDFEPTIWASSDGFEWTILTDAVPGVSGYAIPVALHADATGLVATAYAGETARAFGWTSVDGITWGSTFDESVVMRTGSIFGAPLGGIVDIVEFGEVLIGVGHLGVYGSPGELDTSEFCGGGGSSAPSCRTDATVWIGNWFPED